MNGNGSHAAPHGPIASVLPLPGAAAIHTPSSSASDPSDPVEAAVAAAAARQALELRHLSAAMQRLYEAQLQGRERDIAALLECLRATEQDRDALSASLHDLETRFQRTVAGLRAVGAAAARHAERAEQPHGDDGAPRAAETPSGPL